jgi:hypothetical protein
MSIELIRETHTWTVDGVTVIGVTASLKASGILKAWGDESDLRRGQLVHECVHAYFDNDLGEVPEWLVPYLDGVKNFVAETGFKPFEWEVAVYHKALRYAGMADCIGIMRGQRLPVIVDWASGPVPAWKAIQTAGYAQAKGAAFHRIGVGIGPSAPGGRNYACKHWGIETLAQHTKVFNASLIVAEFLKAA